MRLVSVRYRAVRESECRTRRPPPGLTRPTGFLSYMVALPSAANLIFLSVLSAVAARKDSDAAPAVDDVPFGDDDNAGAESGNPAAPQDHGCVGKTAPKFKTERTPRDNKP